MAATILTRVGGLTPDELQAAVRRLKRKGLSIAVESQVAERGRPAARGLGVNTDAKRFGLGKPEFTVRMDRRAVA
ncbi:MAG TPA: hypothetical protein VFX28_15705, partial [Methylomirabilota bacterium]|nr:hypothetical protein [Methylomirabilota bacterium]